MEVNVSVDVVGIGSAIVDIFVEMDGDLTLDFQERSGTMSLIDRMEARRLVQEIDAFVVKEQSGGSVANTLVGISSFGLSTQLIARVSDDRLGEIFTQQLKEARVEFIGTKSSHGEDSGRCVVFVAPDGERTMFTYLGASLELSIEDVEFAFLEKAKIVYLEGYLLDVGGIRRSIKSLITRCSRNGIEVALSLSDPFVVERYRDEILELLGGGVSIVFANEQEACLLYECKSHADALKRFQEAGLKGAITLGPAGAIGFDGSQVVKVAAEAVEAVIDTTGAGDLFAAGYLAALCLGKPLLDQVTLAVKAAAEVISHFGARPKEPLALYLE